MSYAQVEAQWQPSPFWLVNLRKDDKVYELLGAVASFAEAAVLVEARGLRLMVSGEVRAQMEAADVAPAEWPAKVGFGPPLSRPAEDAQPAARRGAGQSRPKSGTRDQALAALTQAVESGATAAAIIHLASGMADAQLAEAMASRVTIEQAKGIVMRDKCCTPDEAFTVLTLLSQKQNRKVHDVAQRLVDSARR